MKTHNKRYVTYTDQSGLANRIRMHCIAHAYALKTGRKLIVNWKRNKSCFAKYHDIFSAGASSLEMLPASERLYFHLARFFSARSFRKGMLANRLGVDALPEVSEKVVVLRQGLEASTEHGSRFGNFHNEVINSLVPNPDVRSVVDKFLQPFNQPLVGIHIRMGDFIQEHGDSLPPIQNYIEIAKEIHKHRPDVCFIVASDGSESELEPLFSAVKCYMRPRNPSRADIGGIRDALTDIFVLSHTDLVVSTPRSSFSAVAAMIGGRPLLRASSTWQEELPVLIEALPK